MSYFVFRQPGYVTLIAVLIIGTIGTLIAGALLESGLDASRIGTTNESAAIARSQARLCVERALDIIRSQTAFTGTLAAANSESACTSTVSDTGGSTRQILTTTTAGNVLRILRVSLSSTYPIAIGSWQEVP